MPGLAELLTWITGRSPPASTDPWASNPWSLERPLLHFSRGDGWTIGDACGGTQIFGDPGSGKTTGSGQAIALAMLRAGFGGLVLTVKSSETDRWRRYMEIARRPEEDLIVFSPEGPHRFNFLEYERTRASRGGGRTANIAELFVTLANSGDGAASAGHRDAYWDRALRQLLRNIIDTLRIAQEPITLERMHRVVTSAPLSAEESDDEHWQRGSYLFELLATANERPLSDPDRRDLAVTTQFWLTEFAGVLDPKTRGNIVSTFTTMADGFMRGDLRELFCTALTITPEATFEGKVIVLDLPERQFHELGRLAQVIWKHCWQRSVEASGRGAASRPVFLWVDEAQNFITPDEPRFVQTAREHKACCVYLTQSRANYLHALGSQHAAAVESFLGVPKTKIFHCNGDPETNRWAERVIADGWKSRFSNTTTEPDRQPGRQGPRNSRTLVRQREPRVHAADFGTLRCGGPPGFTVQAILFQSGRCFIGGEGNIARLTFHQNPEHPRR